MRCLIRLRRLSGLRRGAPWPAPALIALAGVAAAAISTGASARGATLRWKFTPGETLHYTMDQKTSTTAKLPGGEEIKTTLSQTIELRWVVKGVDGGGTAELVQTFDRIRDQVDARVGSYTYDSKDPKEPEGLLAVSRVPLFKALLGAPVAFKMGPTGEPADVRVPEQVTRALRDLGPAAAGAGAMFSEEGLKEMITQAGLIVPRDDVEAGKTWTRQFKNVIPTLGTVVVDETYRLDGPAPDVGPVVFKIGLSKKLEIQPAAADPNSPDPNPVAGGLKVRSQKSQGTYHFDNAAGHLRDSTLDDVVEVGSTFKVNVGAVAKEMEVIQTTETRTVRKLVKAEKGG